MISLICQQNDQFIHCEANMHGSEEARGGEVGAASPYANLFHGMTPCLETA